MLLRQGQHGEHLHGPVGRPGGVVTLGEDQVRIAVADGQHAVPVEYGLLHPPAQVFEQQPLDPAPIQPVGGDIRQGAGAEEGPLGEAVGQAAAVGQRPSLAVEPGGEPRGDLPGPADEPRRALRVPLAHEPGIHHAVVVKGPQGVVVPLGRLVVVPAVAAVVALQCVQVSLQPLFVGGQSHVQKATVHQHPEEQPVVLGHFIMIDLVQPAVQVAAGGLRQFIIKALGNHAQGHAHHGHLHHPLVEGADVTPIFRVVGVHAVDDALPPQGPVFFRLRALAREHRHQRPQHPGKALHARDGRVVHRAGVADVQPCPALRKAGHQRLDQIHRQANQVRAGFQGIGCVFVHRWFLFVYGANSDLSRSDKSEFEWLVASD